MSQKKSKADLSENIHRAIIDSMHDYVQVIDRDFTVVAANRAHKDFLARNGLEPEFEGKNLFEAIPFLPPRVREQYLDVITSGRTLVKEDDFEMNGRPFIHEVVKTPIVDNGKVKFVVTVVRDITEPRLMVEAARRSEAEYRALVQSVGSIILRLDHNGNIVFANDFALRFFGWSAEELYSLPTVKTIIPETESTGRDLAEMVRDLVSDPAKYAVNENENMKKSGERVLVAWSNRAIVDESGQTTGILCVGNDVTALRKSQAILQAVVKGTAAVTGEDFFRSLVKTLATALGVRYAMAVELTDQNTARSLAFFSGNDFIENQDYELPDTPCEEVLRKKLCVYPRDVRGMFPASAMIQEMEVESYMGTLIEDFQGNPCGILLVMHDRPIENVPLFVDVLNVFAVRAAAEIGRMRAEQSRISLEQKLLHSQKLEAVGKLAGGVAHDFNNLLTAILGYAEISLSQLDPQDPLYNDVIEIKKAGDRAAAVTRQLLAFSRRQILSPRVIDLNQIIAEMEKMLRRLLGEDIKLVISLQPKLDLIKADPGQIEQAIVNLAVNARDAMAKGGVLRVSTSMAVIEEEHPTAVQGLKPGDCVVLTVADNGPGMGAEELEHVFEPFYTSTELGISGLGLPTVHGIIEQSGGRILAYSEPGAGATFEIYFPVTREAREVVAGAAAKQASGRGVILLVEDEDTVRKFAEALLTKNGYRVLAAANPKEAMEICGRCGKEIRLLVTDIVLPEMNGFDLSESIKEKCPGLKIIFMSGYSDDMILRRGSIGPDTAFIQKPFSTVDFIALVNKAISS